MENQNPQKLENIVFKLQQLQILIEEITEQIQLYSQKTNIYSHNSSSNGSIISPKIKINHFENHQFKNGNSIVNHHNDKNIKLQFFPFIDYQNNKNHTPSRLNKKRITTKADSPVAGVKLGRDEKGNPGWFLDKVTKKGTYKLLKLL